MIFTRNDRVIRGQKTDCHVSHRPKIADFFYLSSFRLAYDSLESFTAGCRSVQVREVVGQTG